MLLDEPGDEVAFLPARHDEDIVDLRQVAQVVDMPMRRLVDRQMSPQPGPDAAGTISAAAVEIAAGRETRIAEPRDGQDGPPIQPQRQNIGATLCRKAFGVDGYWVFSPVLRTVTVSPARTKETVPLEPL